ncbi:MAG: N-acetylmuramoyl-L-alanine amidase [Spirochaetaceae bacterium]
MKFSFLIILLLNSLFISGNVPLFELINKSESEIKWNPHRKKGIINKKDVSISFMLDCPTIILNYNEIISGVSFFSEKDEIYVDDESAKLLYRLLKIYEPHEAVVNDEDLFSIPVIIIDPGHGGRDSGALGGHKDFKIQEKDVVLDISKKVVQKLKDNYLHKKILMTRGDDTYYSLEERVELANKIELEKKEAVIYISIHANASLKKKAQGFEVWYLPKDYRRNVLEGEIEDSNKLNSIVNALKEDEISLEGQQLAESILIGLNSIVGELSSNRGLKEEIWFVVRKARMASVLIEVGFITNEIEGKRLTEQEYLQKIADGIYNGITNFVATYEKSGR